MNGNVLPIMPILLVVLLIVSKAVSQPIPSKTFVFGYGSLMYSISRNRTLPGYASSPSYAPAILKGYTRSWEYSSPTGTFLGVYEDQGGIVNGIAFAIDPTLLVDLDLREVNYTRTSLNVDQVQTLTNGVIIAPTDIVWIYVLKERVRATLDRPIHQRYIDICMVGAMELGGEDYALEFVQLTHGWDAPIVNDRHLLPISNQARHEIDMILEGLAH